MCLENMKIYDAVNALYTSAKSSPIAIINNLISILYDAIE